MLNPNYIKKLTEIKEIKEQEDKVKIIFKPIFKGFDENNFRLFNKLINDIYKSKKKVIIFNLNENNKEITNKEILNE